MHGSIHRRRIAGALLLVLMFLAGHTAAAQQSGGLRQYATPGDAGFSAESLAAVHASADSVESAAVVALYRGHVLAAWGDIARPIPAHSVRKSLVSALYGATMATGAIDLDATLGALGIADHDTLLPIERGARIRHLLSARSGVFLPAAYAPSDQDAARPSRGSRAPGTHWYYNNWDFNVAGVIYEQLTGTDLYEAFDARIAQPIGMEDFDPADGYRAWEPTTSRHPAHTFDISARDLARVGQLFLQQGRWGDRQIIPADWVRESTRPHSDFGNGTGYGYMWWTYRAGSLGASYPHLDRHDLFMGRGTGGQALFVIPAAELVIVHRGDTPNGREVDGVHVWAIAERILAARQGKAVPRSSHEQGEAASRPSLVPVRAKPFASQRPMPARRFVALSPAQRDRLLGDYVLGPSATIRVFVFDDRLFIHVPGEGEAEMFALSPTEFTLRVVAGVRIRFEEEPDGAVRGMVLTLGPREMRARRR